MTVTEAARAGLGSRSSVGSWLSAASPGTRYVGNSSGPAVTNRGPALMAPALMTPPYHSVNDLVFGLPISRNDDDSLINKSGVLTTCG